MEIPEVTDEELKRIGRAALIWHATTHGSIEHDHHCPMAFRASGTVEECNAIMAEQGRSCTNPAEHDHRPCDCGLEEFEDALAAIWG